MNQVPVQEPVYVFRNFTTFYFELFLHYERSFSAFEDLFWNPF